MKSTRLLSLVSAFAAVALAILVLTNSTEKADFVVVDAAALPVPTPATDGSKTGKVTTSGGLTTVTFETNPGTVRVHLPDDMRAGDTISGTLVTEPKGQTKEERTRNRSALSQYEVMIANSRPGANDFILKLFRKKTTTPNTGTGSNIDFSEPCVCPFGFAFTGGGQFVTVKQTASTLTGAEVPATCVGGCPAFLAYGSVLDNASGDATTVEAQYLNPLTETQVQQIFEKETEKPASEPKPKEFRLPAIGQQGSPLEIFGPFDGNASNTTLRFGPLGSTLQDFEKGTENVQLGFGVIKPLAESPRKLVFEVPANLIGPIELNVKDGSNQATGTHRNVGVRLSAPKTNLLKGEKTTLTTEVSGLQGITKPVPLTLTSEGVITMEGGPFQQFMIKPSEVNASGKYTTTRQVTGIMAGGWGATATVVTDGFNMRLQDDNDPNRLFHFNSFTGNYIFACGGGSCRNGAGETSGQPPTGSSVPPPPVTLTGIGKPQMKGCIITLSHNAPDRRVFARLDACTKTGDASVETTSPKTKINVTDKNTADNTTSPPPPK